MVEVQVGRAAGGYPDIRRHFDVGIRNHRSVESPDVVPAAGGIDEARLVSGIGIDPYASPHREAGLPPTTGRILQIIEEGIGGRLSAVADGRMRRPAIRRQLIQLGGVGRVSDLLAVAGGDTRGADQIRARLLQRVVNILVIGARSEQARLNPIPIRALLGMPIPVTVRPLKAPPSVIR